MKRIILAILLLFTFQFSFSQCLDCEKDSLSVLYVNHKNLLQFAQDLTDLQPDSTVTDSHVIYSLEENRKALYFIVVFLDAKRSAPTTLLSSFSFPTINSSDTINLSFNGAKFNIEVSSPISTRNDSRSLSMSELKDVADFIEKEKFVSTSSVLSRSKLTTLDAQLGKVELVAKGESEAAFSNDFKSLKLSDFGGSAWQQQVIFGLTDFLLERAKKEINASFIQAFKDVLKKDKEVSKFFEEVFPKTMKIIDNFGDYDVKNILPEFKKAVELDYQAFPYSFPEYTAYLLNKYSEENGNKSLNYIAASMFVLSDFNKSIINGVNPVEGLMCGINDLNKAQLKDTVLLSRLKLIKSIYCFRSIYLDELMQNDQRKYFHGDFRTQVLQEDTSLFVLNVDSIDSWKVEDREKFVQYWNKNRKGQFLNSAKGLWAKKLLSLYQGESIFQKYILAQTHLDITHDSEVNKLIVDLLGDFNSIWDVYDQHKLTMNSLKSELTKQTEISKVNLYKDSIRQEKVNLTINILPHGIHMLETVVHFSIDQLDAELDSAHQVYWKEITSISTNGIQNMIIPLLEKDYSAMVVNGIDLLSDLAKAISNKDQKQNNESLEEAVANSKLTGGIDAAYYEAQLNLIKNEIANSLEVDSTYYANNFTPKLKKELKEKAKELNWRIKQIKDSEYGVAYIDLMNRINISRSSGVRPVSGTSSFSSGIARSVANNINSATATALSGSPASQHVDYLFSIHPDTLLLKIETIGDKIGEKFSKKKVSDKNTMQTISKIGKLLSFTSNIATAKDYEQVQVALNNFMDPVGGFKYKRIAKEKRFYATLNSYIGWNVNYLDGAKYNEKIRSIGSSMSPTLSLGIECGWSFNSFNFGFYGGFLELGALAAFRLDGNSFDSLQVSDSTMASIDQTSNQYVTFEQVFAPSIALTFGFSKKFPIALLVGYRYSPSLWNYNFKSNTTEFRSKANVHQLYFSLVADLTLFRFNRRL